MGTASPQSHDEMIDVNQVNDLFDAQLSVWEQARNNYAALGSVKVKTVTMPDGAEFKVQFNPARIVSSGAKVDAASLKARPCFLCQANRPAVQEGIEWRKYAILINPFPIFPRHLTIPDVSHTPQRIAGRIPDMLELAVTLRGYTIFYNGPRCGASAPDHMHFQAGNSDFLPITSVPIEQGIRILGNPNMIVLTDGDAEKIARTFSCLYDMLPIPDGDEEPMMNILCWYDSDKYHLAVIPRHRHRPSFYGTEGDGCMLLSPASVDMGRAFITPREQDFVRLDADLISTVLDELCFNSAEIEHLVEQLEWK